MKLKYNKNVNELIDQANKNLDEMFGLFKTVQKQVKTISDMMIDGTADGGKKVAKELISATDEIAGETLRLAKDSIDNSVKAVFPADEKK